MSAEALRRALGSLAIDAEVEPRERLAVLRPADAGAARRIAAERGRVVALAGEHGFSHVAVELAES